MNIVISWCIQSYVHSTCCSGDDGDIPHSLKPLNISSWFVYTWLIFILRLHPHLQVHLVLMA